MLPPAGAPRSPDTLALSLKPSPSVPEAGSWVVAIAGWAWAISTGSSAFFFEGSGDLRDLHSFPTRRSSDLCVGLAPWGVEYSPSPSTLTGPSEASTPPSEASQLLLE